MIDIDALIVKANNLEPLPQSVTRLVELVTKDDVDVGEVEKVFSYDGPLTSRLLRQANSAASGSRNPIGTVSAAVVRLGFGSILALAISICVQKKLAVAVPQYDLEEGELWKHAQASRIAVDAMKRHCSVTVPPEAQTAALLHDIGKIVMAQYLAADILDYLHKANPNQSVVSVHSETEILEVHHGELGGIIAQHWHLPEIIVRGIIFHHAPEVCDEGDNTICHIVCVADWLAKAADAKVNDQEWTEPLPASTEFLGLSLEACENLIEIINENLAALA